MKTTGLDIPEAIAYLLANKGKMLIDGDGDYVRAVDCHAKSTKGLRIGFEWTTEDLVEEGKDWEALETFLGPFTFPEVRTPQVRLDNLNLFKAVTIHHPESICNNEHKVSTRVQANGGDWSLKDAESIKFALDHGFRVEGESA